jgi:hypothetical protein
MNYIKNILIKEINFKNGKWEGELEAIIYHQDEFFSGIIPFTYVKNWNIQGLKYPKKIKESLRQSIRKEVVSFKHDIFSFIETSIIQHRELYAPKPIIQQLKIDKTRSFKNNLYIDFTLKGSTNEFFALLFLVDNMWHCEIKTKLSFDEYHQSFLAWEDVLFDSIVEELKKNPTLRMKLVVYSKSYKFQ